MKETKSRLFINETGNVSLYYSGIIIKKKTPVIHIRNKRGDISSLSREQGYMQSTS